MKRARMISPYSIERHEVHVPFPYIQIENGYIVIYKGDDDPIKIGRAIKIESIETNIDTNTVVYNLNFKYGGRDINVKVDRGDLTRLKLPRLLSLGADIYEDNVTNVIKHLRNQELLAPEVNVHTVLGWDIYNGESIYKHYHATGVESTFNGELAIEPEGDLELWKDMVKSEVVGHVPLEMALVLGFSAITIGFISDQLAFGSLFVHLAGDSTTGKTTAVMLAGSVAGCVDSKRNGLFGTWNITRNAMMGQLRDNYGLPSIFDEASMANIKDFTNMIYMLTEGKEKGRMTKELDLREQSNWRTTILSTGEHGLVLKSKRNAGLRVRILEFSDVTWTKSASNSEAIKDAVLKNYGHAASLFAEHLLGIGQIQVIEHVESWRKRILTELDNIDRFVERSSLKLAILLATASLVNEQFEFSLAVENLLKFLIQNETQSADERDLGKRAYFYFLEQVVINAHRFSTNYGERTKGISEFETVSGEHWGRWDNSSSVTEISITKKAFTQILNDGGFEDPHIILKKWKQRGFLNCEADRLTRKRKLSPTSPVLDLYVVKVDRSLMEEQNQKVRFRGDYRSLNGSSPLKVVE